MSHAASAEGEPLSPSELRRPARHELMSTVADRQNIACVGEAGSLISPERAAILRRRLLAWWRPQQRDLPWRRSQDPYRVLLAEILLQQTHHRKVIPAYGALLHLAPDPAALALAADVELVAIIRPLGLVGRAKTLKRLGEVIVERHGGRMPKAEKELLALPGVGWYSARAVRCFAYGTSEPLVDRLTARFYRRLFGLGPIERPGRSRSLWKIVHECQPKRPRDFHLAVIDFTSLVCKARRPLCPECPLQSLCVYGLSQAAVHDVH
jgi:A/G-specific adenine glycosylase